MTRLIDAEALKEYYELGDKCQSCRRDAMECIEFNYFSLYGFCCAIDSMPTVEAIPVEQVARIINDIVADDTPCNYRWLNDKGAGHCEFCDETCKSFEGFRGDGEHWMCWEHAIREGWLDE